MTPFRLAVIVAVGGALAVPASSQTMPTVTITLGSHYFVPSPIYLAGGVPVRLVFINQAFKTHDFSAPAFFHSARIRSGRPPRGKIVLAGGRGTQVTLVPRRGTYRVHCSRFLHSQLGMHTRIVVT